MNFEVLYEWNYWGDDDDFYNFSSAYAGRVDSVDWAAMSWHLMRRGCCWPRSIPADPGLVAVRPGPGPGIASLSDYPSHIVYAKISGCYYLVLLLEVPAPSVAANIYPDSSLP